MVLAINTAMNRPNANNLIGRIRHVITPSSDNVANTPAGNKRPRPWETDGTDSTYHRQGFVFITDEGKEILLTMPNSIIRTACYASVTGKTVELSRYTLIHYRNGRGEVVFDSRGGWVGDVIETHKKDDEQTITVAEVHRGGIAFNVDENDATKITRNQQNEPILTLQMFSRKEQVDLTSKKRKSSKSVNITATVDAVSPIFTHDSERPFALMELYQPNTTTANSAVAVIRGEHALCMHAAIHPGVNITLMGVVSRSWKVPEGFQQSYMNCKVKNDHVEAFFERLYHRTPDRVILTEDPNCIHFNHEDDERRLPSTVKSLTSVDGCIESVNYYRYKNTQMDDETENILHFVTLKSCSYQNLHDGNQEWYDSDGNDDTGMRFRTVRINLIKYSSSPHVLLGLQPGALVRAVNIHRITSQTSKEETYVACLRSTVSIECCATDRNSNPGLYFISNASPFKMVPNHRIAKIVCSNSSNSISSTRYFVEDSLRMKIQQLHPIHDPDELTRQLGMLMAHHYKTSDSCDTLAPTILQALNVRDPYSEFFDHAHMDDCEIQNECGNYTQCDFSNFCCQENSVRSAPNIVRLNVLRDTCVQDFTKRIASFCTTDSRVSSGSTSSYHYYSSKVYAWGQVNLTEQNSVFAGYVVYDNCEIPLLVPIDVNGLDMLKNRYPGWIQVKSVLVSCLCLGRMQCDDKERSNDDSLKQQMSADAIHFLPSSPTDEKIIGHNFVFTVNELVFIGSVQFIVIPVASEDCFIQSSTHNTCTQSKQSPLSIQDCLKQTCIDQDHTSAIVGRLTRQRFQFRKSKRAQYYEGWTITLSHIDEDDNSISSSFLQTIDVYVKIPVEKPSDFFWNTLKATLRVLLSNDSKESDNHIDPLKKVSSDQLTMGLAFLRASGYNSSHPILCGGWESCNNQLLSESETYSYIQTISVHVKIPLASREIAKLGYQRFRCCLEDLKAFATIKTYTIPKSPCPSELLDFRVNTMKFLPGMLNRRMCRVKSPPCHNATANTPQLLHAKNPHNPLNDSIPIVTLLDIHYQICQVLSEKQPLYLLPSLFRRIHKAKILGINFCRARAECTQCFEFLISSQSNDSALVCPSECGASHAAIKWECSAVIDDCTGQAKLYAEREAALLLLGSELDIDAVERGAWTSQDGVFFQLALPPSSYLQRCIKEATSEAKKHNTQMMKEDREKYFKSKPATTYDFISTFPLAKSEYLLQQHCREWYQKHSNLKLDLLCRCKPLSNEVTSVNRSDIHVAKAVDGYGLDFGAVQTCTLPPLKLVLEDACLSPLDSDYTTTTWDMLRKLSSS